MYPGGHARGLLRPTHEDDVARFLARTHPEPVLAIGAQSSLTGGAVPMGDWLVTTATLDTLGPVHRLPTGGGRVVAGPGVTLARLQEHVGRDGLYYPPVPTYDLATLGGTVATNAAGSATFKYGPTRPWVRRIRIVLPSGDRLEVERGAHVAPAGGHFELVLPSGQTRLLPVPTYRPPPVKKQSMGYHTADALDLIDLFIGSEGTLGIVTEVEVALVENPAAVLAGLVFAPTEAIALHLVRRLRDESLSTRALGDARGLDVRAIESMDQRSLALLRAQGLDRRLRVPLPADARTALYFEMELSRPTTQAQVLEHLEAAMAHRAPEADTPVARLLSRIGEAGLLDRLEIAFPDDPGARERFFEVREAVPRTINEVVAANRRHDPAISKLAADCCVPFEALPDFLWACREAFEARGLDHAIFGHVSDGNLHPNVIAVDSAQMRRGREAILAIGDRVKELCGSPMAEHGVGRNPLKQELLRRYYGDEGIAQMRALRRAVDPAQRLGRGILFPPGPALHSEARREMGIP